MSKRTEGHFSGHDGQELFYQTWIDDSANGTIVITHGMSEHSECYHWLAKELNRLGWNVYAWDLRGHGRSEGRRGLVKEFTDYCKDLVLFYNTVKSRVNELSHDHGATALFGHSMGGLISARTLIEHSAIQPDALCLSAPAFGLSMPVPVLKEKASHFLARFAPNLTLKNEINYAALSHDPKMLNFYPNDPLRHDKISAKLYLGMVESFEFVLENCKSLQLPCFMQVSGDDLIVSLEKQEVFYKRISSSKKELVVYKDSYHEVFNDFEKEQALSDLAAFLQSLNEIKH